MLRSGPRAPNTADTGLRRRLVSALAVPAAALATSFVVTAGLTAQAAPALRVDSASVLVSPSSWAAAPAPRSPEPLAFRPPTGAGILGGTVGSGVGLIGGAFVGYSMATCDQGEWFCGFGEAAVGALVGSVVGSTLGANIGARRGGATPTFESTVVAGLAGVLTGFAGGYLMAQMAPEGPLPLVGFSLGQGIVTGLVAARAH